ncbi:LptF/LptG family permease [Candidatus Pelagibacter sp.]|nr:LptF/LptG family permease [Candidatus Pelagibacter sp.]
MLLKIYQKYIIKLFLVTILKTSLIFLSLIFIMGIFEELSFFSKLEVNFYFPLFLVFLNSFSFLYEIFPFIFLISAQFFFIHILDSNELIAFKNYGLSNVKILKIISLTSFLMGSLIVFIFYNLSAVMKFEYLDLKNQYTNDNRYLASITENGLWIKDQNSNKITFTNAEEISLNKLYDVDILVFNKDFSLDKIIFSKEIDVSNTIWQMDKATIIDKNNMSEEFINFRFNSNFNYEKINNLYSNLSSLTFFDLIKMRSDYKLINYSITEIDLHLKRIFSYPFFLTIMTIFSSIIMLNIKHQKPKIFYIVGGILISVIIYYVNFFFGVLGKNEQIPSIISIWLPILLLSLLSLIGTTRLNEK